MDVMDHELMEITKSFLGKIPAEQLQDMCELIQAGERGVALENLCTQRQEFDIAITEEIFAKIRRIGNAMEINASYWEQLKVSD